MAFAAHEIKLSARQQDGAPLRQHLLAVAQATGLRPPELDGPLLPPSLAHVWAWWRELASARPSTGMGPGAIGWADIAYWSRLAGTAPTIADVRMILQIDRLWLIGDSP